MDPHSGMTGLDMLGSPHSDGMSSGHSMSSSLPISSAVSVDPHSHPSAQLAVNAAAHHSAMYGAAHGAHSAATASMMSPHTSLVHPHHPHHHHTPVVSMQDTDTDPRYCTTDPRYPRTLSLTRFQTFEELNSHKIKEMKYFIKSNFSESWKHLLNDLNNEE